MMGCNSVARVVSMLPVESVSALSGRTSTWLLKKKHYGFRLDNSGQSQESIFSRIKLSSDIPETGGEHEYGRRCLFRNSGYFH